jgi:hypothetical protein
VETALTAYGAACGRADQSEGVLHAGKRLDLAGDEMTDVGLLVEIALQSEDRTE